MTVTRRLLTSAVVRKARPAGQDYELSDGHGLTLSVRASGRRVKFWKPAHKMKN